MFSIRMRSAKGGPHEKGGTHISGCERLVEEKDLPGQALEMVVRALSHSKGKADFIRITMDEVRKEEISYIPCPLIEEYRGEGIEETISYGKRVLAKGGITEEAVCKAVSALLSRKISMRGAMIVSATTGERLDGLGDRGVRVTRMGFENPAEASSLLLSHGYQGVHIKEALVLAGKVLSCPEVLGELCISDDPDYVVGYVSYKNSLGNPVYSRLSPMKELGNSFGGRIFFVKDGANIEEIRSYLETKTVLVRSPLLSERGKIAGGELEDVVKEIEREVETLRSSPDFRTLHTYHPLNAARAMSEGKEYIMMTTNNYLGLAQWDELKCGARRGAAMGTGSGGSRLLSGSFPLFETLERELAALKETESALVFNTGYMANVGVINALVGAKDHILSDSLNHASIIDGARLSHATIHVYPHNDISSLERILQSLPEEGRRLIVTDSVFSMDGDIAPLPKLLELAEKYNALLVVDDAHATGVLGEGRGSAHFFGIQSKRLLQVGTLSKAIGSEGGFVCGSETMISYIRNKARSFIFSTALTPMDIGAAIEGVRLIRNGKAPISKLHGLVRSMTHLLAERNIDVPGKTKNGNVAEDFNETPIFPIIVGSSEKALHVAEEMKKRGIILSAIRPPTVAKGEARLRLTVTADHTEEDLAYVADALKELL